tara:strand:- start:891 stop:1034 length:144 start_codon:yes stop_codon:yes gene_type:complete
MPTIKRGERRFEHLSPKFVKFTKKIQKRITSLQKTKDDKGRSKVCQK